MRFRVSALLSFGLALSACGINEEGGQLFPDSGAGGTVGGSGGGTVSGGGGSASGGMSGTGGGGTGGSSGAGGTAGASGSGGGGTGGASGSGGSGGASGGASGSGGTGGASGGASGSGGTGGATGGAGGASGGSGGATGGGGGSGGATGGSGGASGGSGGATGGSGGASGTGGAGGATGGSGGATGGSGGATGGAGGATGGSGGTTADPCAGLCKDPNATCTASGVCQCASGWVNVDKDADPKTATCVSSIVLGLQVKVAISHEDAGQLTIKLRGPNATVITLVSRPGLNEGSDNGGGILGGELTGYHSGHAVTFDDAAAVAAEDMGATVGPFGYVCKDDNICAYIPDKDSAAGPNSLKGAFQNSDAVGKWTLCVGDSNWLVSGSLEQWELTITTSSGVLTRATPANLAQKIPDDGYDGTLGSMACRDLVVP